MGPKPSEDKVMVGKTDGKRPHGKGDVDDSTTLKYILKNSVSRALAGLFWLGIGTGGGQF